MIQLNSKKVWDLGHRSISELGERFRPWPWRKSQEAKEISPIRSFFSTVWNNSFWTQGISFYRNLSECHSGIHYSHKLFCTKLTNYEHIEEKYRKTFIAYQASTWRHSSSIFPQIPNVPRIVKEFSSPFHGNLLLLSGIIMKTELAICNFLDDLHWNHLLWERKFSKFFPLHLTETAGKLTSLNSVLRKPHQNFPLWPL